MQRFSTLAFSILVGFAGVASLPALAAPAKADSKFQEQLIDTGSTQKNQLSDTDRARIREAILDASVAYDVLAGELYLQRQDFSRSYAYLTQAAQRSGDVRLYERAARIAIAARHPDTALESIREWQAKAPNDPKAYSAQVQLLILQGKAADIEAPLQKMLQYTDSKDLQVMLHAIPNLVEASASNPEVSTITTKALQPYTNRSNTAFVSALSLARIALNNRQQAESIAWLQKAHQATPPTDALGILVPNKELPAFIALDLLKNTPSKDTAVKRQTDDLIRSTISQSGSSPELATEYARTLLQTRRPNEAMQQLERVTQQHPNYAPSWVLKGAAHAQADQLDAAEQALKRYLQVRDKSKDVTIKVSDDERQNRLFTAVQQRSAANSDNNAYILLAMIASKRNQNQEALQWLQRLPDSEERSALLLDHIQELRDAGKVEQALEAAKLLPQNTTQERSAAALVNAQLLEGLPQRQAQAEPLLTKAIAEDPKNASLLYTRGLSYVNQNKLRQAEADLRQALAIEPNSAVANNSLGYILANQGKNLTEARKLISKANKLMPNNVAIMDSMGWVEFRLGNLAEAQKWLERSWQADPSPEIAAHLGEVLWKKGDREQAATIFNKGYQLDPKDAVLQETMQRLGHTPTKAP